MYIYEQYKLQAIGRAFFFTDEDIFTSFSPFFYSRESLFHISSLVKKDTQAIKPKSHPHRCNLEKQKN